MARRRFFVDEVRDGRAEITGDNAHHLARVLRVEKGQKFEISDTRRVWLASVDALHKSRVEFEILEEIVPAPEPVPIHLYLSLIRFERFEWALEKATELGVFRVVPVEAARSDHGLFAGAQKRVARWRRVAHEAGEQSRRLRPPEVASPVRFAEILADSSAHRLWLDENPAAPRILGSFSPNFGENIALAVGPEGGWTQHEREVLAAAGWKGVSLGPSILRTETAVCAALPSQRRWFEVRRYNRRE